MSRKRSDQFARRSSGVLLHPTSLPGPHGCGDLGRWARRFVDFLHASRQSWWQTLPIGPVGSDGCPYHSPSTFAGSELLISLESLQRDGLLRRREIRPMPTSRRRQVDFAATRRYRTQRLRLAYDRFRQFGGDESEALHAFRRRERYWLDDYAMFVALHDRYRGAWVKWPRELRLRHRRSLRRAEQELAYQVGFVRFTQFVFDRQWRELRDYARRRGVRLIGDVPHFVAHDSVDVWANRSLFRLCQFRKTHHRSCATIASTCGGAGGQ